MMLTKALETKLTADDGGRDIVARVSTTTVDRDGDVILPSGLDFKDFMKNPVVLMMHDNQRLGIARATHLEKTMDSVIAKATMLPRPPSLQQPTEWVPDTVLDLFKMGAPLGFSVGFRIKDGGARPATARDKKNFPGVQRVITDWELLEFSVVPIPANQDSLLVAVSKCATPPGSFVRSALGLPTPARVTVVRQPRVLKIDNGRMLRI